MIAVKIEDAEKPGRTPIWCTVCGSFGDLENPVKSFGDKIAICRHSAKEVAEGVESCREFAREEGKEWKTAYEFGCKVSITTSVTSPKGGQFVLHAKALHGNPYDGHTLGPVIADYERLTGVEVRRIHVDKGYRGHNHHHRFRVWTSGQVRHVTKAIRREMRRRAAVEPVIGHLKDGHRMDRNYLKGREGDRANAVLAAAGYNFSLLLRWVEELLRALLRLVLCRIVSVPRYYSAA